jgi:protein phosphatase
MPEKSKNQFSISYFGKSDIGMVRTENQDSYGKFPADHSDLYQPKGVLFIVADGMGGHAGGGEASRSAVDIINQEYFSSTLDIVATALYSAFKTANIKIYETSIDVPQFQRKGTTSTALVLENNYACIAHVGDSRIYRITNGKIEQLTNDHTQVEELLRKGIISNEEAKNHPSKSVLVRALGIEPSIDIDIIKDIPIKPGDNFVICSDGLANVNKEDIKNAVLSNSAEEACEKLISLANESGGTDNVTVQVVKVIENPDEDYINLPKTRKFKISKWLVIFIIFLLAILIFIINSINKNEVKEPLLIGADTVNQNSGVTNLDLTANNAENIILDVNKYIASEEYDSALIILNRILKENPMHAGALNMKGIIENKLRKNAYQLMNKGDYNDALLYFKQLNKYNPGNSEITNTILDIENKIKNDSTQIENGTVNKVKISSAKNKTTIPSKTIREVNTEQPLSSFRGSEWIFNGLTENDYKVNAEGITFFSTGSIKRIISQNSMTDIDIEVSLEFGQNYEVNRAGIILGYNKDKQTKKNIYFLFTVDKNGNILLVKSNNGEEEMILPVKHILSFNQNKQIYKIKLKCLGPWIMIYSNNKLVNSWMGNDLITGKIGLYADANTHVSFNSFKISSAMEF